MKNLILSIFGLLTFAFTSCDSNEHKPIEKVTKQEIFNKDKEKAAIMKVIDGETSCFYARDYECWKKHWVNEDYAFQAWSNGDGTYDAKIGWEAVNTEIGNYIKEHPVEKGKSHHPDVKREDLQIKFYGTEAAYLLWKQYNSNRDKDVYQISQEIRLMEKVGSDWKIVNVSAFWDYKNFVPVDSLKVK